MIKQKHDKISYNQTQSLFQLTDCNNQARQQNNKSAKANKMSEVHMQNYLNRNIYKVSNPPGGQSSISLNWNHTNDITQDRSLNNKITRNSHNKITRNQPFQSQHYNNVHQGKSPLYRHNNSVNYAKPYNNETVNHTKSPTTYSNPYQDQNYLPINHNRSYVSGNPTFRQNSSFLQGATNINKPSSNPNHNNYQPNNQINDRNSYQHGGLSKNLSSPFSYTKKGYAHLMSPNFIQPRTTELPTHDSSIQHWSNSSKLLEQQLKYYQQKNKLLKQKLYGGFTNDQALKQYQPDYHDFTHISSHHQPQQLQMALRQRNTLQDHRHQMKTHHQPYNSVLLDNLSSLINGNGSMIMENQSAVKTSVKVHNPPGGYSSIKLG